MPELRTSLFEMAVGGSYIKDSVNFGLRVLTSCRHKSVNVRLTSTRSHRTEPRSFKAFIECSLNW